MNEDRKKQSAILDYNFDVIEPEQEGTLGESRGSGRVLSCLTHLVLHNKRIPEKCQ